MERVARIRTIPHLRWAIASMLGAASAISYIDRQALSVNASMVRNAFHLTNADYSYLVTSFLIAYTLGYTVLGILVDRLGTKLAFTIVAASWSVAGMLHGIATGFYSLAVFRFLLGFAEGGAVPASVRGVAEWFPARERSTATGIFAAGTPVGTLIAAPLVAFLTLALGWRAAFVVTGALGFLWIVPWLWLYYLPEHHPRLDAAERRAIVEGRLSGPPAGRGSTLALLRHRQAWAIILGRFMVSPVWWFYVFWLPPYLRDVRGFSMEAIGALAWIPFLTGAAGTLAGGWFSGWLFKQTGSLTIARHTVLGLGALGSLLGIPAALAGQAWVCLLLISIVTFAICLWATIIVTLPADILPASAVGSLSGVSGSGGSIGGVLFTLATGWLVDAFSYWPVFCLAAVAPLAGFLVLVALMPRVAPVEIGRTTEAAVSGG